MCDKLVETNSYLDMATSADKIAFLTNKDTEKQLFPGFIVGFIHPFTKEIIFLANCADISAICYSDDPKLPGTKNVKLAKFYANLEKAKNDIYLLRYHHRQFLKIVTIAKPAAHFRAQLSIPGNPIGEEEVNTYTLPELTTDLSLYQESSEI